MVPAGTALGLIIWLTRPPDYGVPLPFIMVAMIGLFSAMACLLLMPFNTTVAVNRFIMTKYQPSKGWLMRGILATSVVLLMLLGTGAVVLPFAFGVEITLVNYLLSLLIAAGLSLTLAIIEVVFMILVFIVHAKMVKRNQHDQESPSDDR
ncbi:hypothetical protein AMJ57_02490 [Parcubacteria bacterium SG8_24]|nr:MAG: hypothetical protein AMJ57_02490 [Parcubacteria bacterium SG8_24]